MLQSVKKGFKLLVHKHKVNKKLYFKISGSCAQLTFQNLKILKNILFLCLLQHGGIALNQGILILSWGLCTEPSGQMQ